ncbi:MAG TPA: PHP domain-containing protein [Candidatus Saccharimonadales bacterium]|nr:PHP domain-containing protein [Candidatus Saccharimonadales bacterium]
MTNLEIAQLLMQVAAAFVIKDERKFHFQIVAYQRAADSIANMSTQVADLVRENKLAEVPGLGASLQQHLTDLVTKGKVDHFESVMKDVPPAMFPLLLIPSFGPKKSYKLVTIFHLENPATVIADVEKIAQDGKIATLEGFGEKSQSDILRAIDEYRAGAGKTTRMLLPYATEIAEKMVSYLKECPEVIDAQPLGSLRRKSPTVGDVDIAVATKNPQVVLDHFVAYPYKERVIEKGPATSSLLTSGGHQVDLMTQPAEAWGSLLQHFTGSKHHNVHLRDYALKHGMSLSEYGIKHLHTNSEEREKFTSEGKFYQAIGLDWIPPELREDKGEIEAAAKHQLPRLVETTDIKGDLHIHSNYPIEPSHDLGLNSMQEMLTHAKELGYEYLGFSEHNPSVSKHTSAQALAILQKRADKIEQLKESNKDIRVINLLETDILASGELAIDNKSLETLDATLVSIHSSFSLNTKDMTKRVLAGLSHPKAKILSHPTGRLLNERGGYQLEWDTIFDFCAKQNKALEINAWPERTDLPDSLIFEAKKYGVRFVIDTDSHATMHMDAMRYGVWNARRGWAEKDDILNTLDYNGFIKWLQS